MEKFKILIAEDNALNRENLLEMLSPYGYDIETVKDGKEAMDTLLCNPHDLIIADLNMPNIDGLELLKFIKQLNPKSIVIIVTAYGTVESAVQAIKLGAFDYISKPLKEDMVRLTVERALSYSRLIKENISLKKQLREQFDFGKMIGYSAPIKAVFDTIKKVAASDSTIIVYGESGTGKELVARAIHFNSDRREYPLVTVNCGAIPEDLLESELFGHEKGAFTGAIRSRMGRFELAQKGSIFLDEIGDMSPSLQVKLLRIIQEKQFERIGSVKTTEADVRIIAATNQDLEKAVEEKKFREDLFYRINVIPIYLPPLRKRGTDISILANHFVRLFNSSKKKCVQGITPKAMEAMLSYNWPGNVRELQNIIEMLIVLKEDGYIDREDLPEKISSFPSKPQTSNNIEIPDGGLDFNEIIKDFEKDLLYQALQKTQGIKNRAAKLLNLNRTTFVEKLKRHKIDS